MLRLNKVWKTAAVRAAMAAAVIVAPSLVQAAPAANAVQAAATPVTDVKITEGVLTGTLRDAGGQPVDGALVVVGQRGVEIARTVTDREGRYAVENLQAGQYVIVSGNVGRVVRLWETSVAPPASAPEVALAPQAGATRGQAGLGVGMLSTVSTGAAVVGAGVAIGLGVEAQDEAEEAADENDELREELRELQEEVSNSNP